MRTFLHLSDTHFGSLSDEVVDAAHRLWRELRPDALLLTGDITQRARAPQFAAARAFVDQLAPRLFLSIPGNHDIPLYDGPARLFWPYAGYKRHFGSDLEPVIDTDELLAIGVNTTSPLRHKHGEVSERQIERVRERLSRARPGQLRVVATHHPARVVREKDHENRLRGGERAAQAWADAGADLLLGGHIHLPYVVEVPAAPGAATPGSMHCLQAGTGLSSRTRHGVPNSLNVVHWEPPAPGSPRTCHAERWDYDVADERFELTHEYPLALG